MALGEYAWIGGGRAGAGRLEDVLWGGRCRPPPRGRGERAAAAPSGKPSQRPVSATFAHPCQPAPPTPSAPSGPRARTVNHFKPPPRLPNHHPPASAPTRPCPPRQLLEPVGAVGPPGADAAAAEPPVPAAAAAAAHLLAVRRGAGAVPAARRAAAGRLLRGAGGVCARRLQDRQPGGARARVGPWLGRGCLLAAFWARARARVCGRGVISGGAG